MPPADSNRIQCTGPVEVRVKAMRRPSVIYRTVARRQRLGHQLSAEHRPNLIILTVLTLEAISVDLLQR
jgi:hypothetical protein